MFLKCEIYSGAAQQVDRVDPPPPSLSPLPALFVCAGAFVAGATKSGLQLLSTSVLPFSFRSPPSPPRSPCHQLSPSKSGAALFTLGAVAEMCHRDVMLHTPGDKNRQTLFTHVASVSPPPSLPPPSLLPQLAHTCTRTGKDTSGKLGAEKHIVNEVRLPGVSSVLYF